MMANSATDNAIRALQRQLDRIEARMDRIETEIEARVTVGALQGHHKALTDIVDSVKEGLNRVESKQQRILEPQETIAYIGAEDLRLIKTRIAQMVAIKQDIDNVRQQLVDMLAAYDMGQAAVVT
jgi:archaellum component FlaC